MVFQGPTRPGTDVKKFRRTGVSSPRPIQGPTRPTTDVKKFRSTGRSSRRKKTTPTGNLLQGPLPETTTEAEERTFRETGVTPKSSRTVESQLQGQPSAIDVTQPPAQIGFIEATKRSFRDRNLDPFDLTTSPDVFVSPQGEIIDVRNLSERQKDKLEDLGFRKTSQQELIGEQRERIGTLFGQEIDTEKQFITGLTASLQAKVDSGELTLEDAQRRADLIRDIGEEKVRRKGEDILSGEKAITAGGRTSGVRDIVDLGLFVNPLTSVIAGASSSQDDPQIIDIDAIRSGTTSIEGATTQRPSGRTATFFAGGVLGTSGKVFAADKEILLADIEASQVGARLGAKGTRELVGKGTILDTTFAKFETGGITTMETQEVLSTVAKGGKKAIGVGRVDTVFSGTFGPNIFKQTPFSAVTSKKLAIETGVETTAAGKVTFGVSKIASSPRIDFSSLGKGKDFITETKFSFKFPFERAGVSLGGSQKIKDVFVVEDLGIVKVATKTDDVIFSKGGTLTSASKGGVEFGSFPNTGFLQTDLRLGAETQSKSVLRVLDSGRGGFETLGTKGAEKGLSSFGGGRGSAQKVKTKTQTSQNTLLDLPALDLPKTNFIGKETSLVSKSGSRSASLGFAIPRNVGGQGLTEQQLSSSLSPQTLKTPSRNVFDTTSVSANIFQTGRSSRGRGRQKDLLGLSPKVSGAQISGVKQATFQRQGLSQGLVQKQLQTQFQSSIKPPVTDPFKFNPRGGFGAGFVPPRFPSLGGVGTRGRPRRRTRARRIVRPSFTGIIFGIEKAAVISPTFGVSPFSIRGLETGFNVPKRKKKKKGKKGGRSMAKPLVDF